MSGTCIAEQASICLYKAYIEVRWLWQVSGDVRWLWQVSGGVRWLWQVSGDVRWLWQVSGDVRWLWQVSGGVRWLWQVRRPPEPNPGSGSQWAMAGSSPPESSWWTPLPQGGTLEARTSRGILEVLGLGGARKALNWTEPAEKASWAGPAETKESWAGPAETKESWAGPAETKESWAGPAGSGLCELLGRSGLRSGLCELLGRSGLRSGLCELLGRSGPGDASCSHRHQWWVQHTSNQSWPKRCIRRRGSHPGQGLWLGRPGESRFWLGRHDESRFWLGRTVMRLRIGGHFVTSFGSGGSFGGMVLLLRNSHGERRATQL